MDADFAELLGMHAGDGTIYRVNSGSLVWELRGGLDEEVFYDTYVAALVERCGLDTFWIGKRGRAYGVRSCKKSWIERILQAGFPVGAKSLNLRIPATIIRSERHLQASFLRGVFATDGSTSLVAINGNVHKSYPYVELTSASEEFIQDAWMMLETFGIGSYLWSHGSTNSPRRAYRLRVAGIRRVRRFEAHIGLSNPKHRRRIGNIVDDNL